MAYAVTCSGEPRRAIDLLTRAMRLNPYHPDWYLWHLGDAYFDLGEHEQTVLTLGKMRDQSEANRLLAASYAYLGHAAEAATTPRRSWPFTRTFRSLTGAGFRPTGVGTRSSG
jgi:adenylate cyclase